MVFLLKILLLVVALQTCDCGKNEGVHKTNHHKHYDDFPQTPNAVTSPWDSGDESLDYPIQTHRKRRRPMTKSTSNRIQKGVAKTKHHKHYDDFPQKPYAVNSGLVGKSDGDDTSEYSILPHRKRTLLTKSMRNLLRNRRKKSDDSPSPRKRPQKIKPRQLSQYLKQNPSRPPAPPPLIVISPPSVPTSSPLSLSQSRKAPPNPPTRQSSLNEKRPPTSPSLDRPPSSQRPSTPPPPPNPPTRQSSLNEKRPPTSPSLDRPPSSQRPSTPPPPLSSPIRKFSQKRTQTASAPIRLSHSRTTPSSPSPPPPLRTPSQIPPFSPSSSTPPPPPAARITPKRAPESPPKPNPMGQVHAEIRNRVKALRHVSPNKEKTAPESPPKRNPMGDFQTELRNKLKARRLTLD